MTGWWDELAVAALLGTDRRALPDAAALPAPLAASATRLDGDPAAVLLDTAALAVAYRRAGVRPCENVGPPAVSPVESRRQPTPRATALLASVLRQDVQLLRFWCDSAATAGLVAPHECLPALLDRAVEEPALRSTIVPVLGERGWWLAELHPRWSGAVAGHRRPEVTAGHGELGIAGDARSGGGGRSGGDGRSGGGARSGDGAQSADALLSPGQSRLDLDAWRFGAPAQRADWLLAARRSDPAGALAALAGTWDDESSRDRAAFVAVLEHGLSDADEGFLEAALDDRTHGVRAVAVELLARLPSSAYVARMRSRATALIRVERALTRSRVVVEVPDRLDLAAGRDGLTDHRSGHEVSPEARRVWWLEQVVGAAPLDVWPVLLGAPEKAVRTGFDDAARLAIRAGWAWAAVRQRNPQWAEALLRTGTLSRVEELVALLAPDQLTPVLLDWLAAVRPADRVLIGRYLSGAPGPWPPQLVQVACGRLLAMTQQPLPNAGPAATLLQLIAFRAPPTGQSRQDLLAVAVQLADTAWAGRVRNFAQIIDQRIRIHEELQ